MIAQSYPDALSSLSRDPVSRWCAVLCLYRL